MLTEKKLLGLEMESRNLSKSFINESITALVSALINNESNTECWAYDFLLLRHNNAVNKKIKLHFMKAGSIY